MMVEHIAQRALRMGARALIARKLHLKVEGWQHLPRYGPSLIVSNHVHHLYDGCLFLSLLPRTPRYLVALDWVKHYWFRLFMEWACRTAQWPIVLRTDRLHTSSEKSAYQSDESFGYLRSAVRLSVELLRNDQILVVFPEAYAAIDPHPTPKSSMNEIIPFRPGFVHLVQLAQRATKQHIPIIPVSLMYKLRRKQWHVTLRFGAPIFIDRGIPNEQAASDIEARIRLLSSEDMLPTNEERVAIV